MIFFVGFFFISVLGLGRLTVMFGPSFIRLLACKAEAGINFQQFFTVIGLVAQLAGSFFLAARGFTSESLRRLPLASSSWIVALMPAFVTTSFLLVAGLLPVEISRRWLILFVTSLICSIGWVPALAKHAANFADTPRRHLTDSQVERLNVQGMALLIIGFILSAFGAVLA